MDFSEAFKALKQGKRVTRKGWSNITAIFLVQGSTFAVNRAPLNQFFSEGQEVTYNPHIDCITLTGTVGVWTAAQSDILAEDWEVVVDLLN